MIPYSVAVDGWDSIQTSCVYDGHIDAFTEMGASSCRTSVLLFILDAAFSLLPFNNTSSFSLGENRIQIGEVAALKNSSSRMATFAFRVLHSPSVRTPLKRFNTTNAYMQLLESAPLF